MSWYRKESDLIAIKREQLRKIYVRLNCLDGKVIKGMKIDLRDDIRNWYPQNFVKNEDIVETINKLMDYIEKLED